MTIEISAVMVISERFENTDSMYRDYSSALKQTGKTFEFLCVLDGQFPEILASLDVLRKAGENLKVVELGKHYGEATALNVALQHSSGDVILTLPPYAQVKLDNLNLLIEALEDADAAIAIRWPRRDSRWNRFQTWLFRSVLMLVSGTVFRDLGCGVRAFKRVVFDEVPVYGDLHRFLPVLAEKAGFRVREVELAQTAEDSKPRVYAPGIYIRRLLDMLTVFFLVKFTKKPLRFFGLIGGGTAGIGAAIILWIVAERFFFSIALGDRPALLLSSLLFAVGVQLMAVGLIGELIIFTHARELKEYSIDRIAELHQDHPGDVTSHGAASNTDL